jgi:hypothetical protein
MEDEKMTFEVRHYSPRDYWYISDDTGNCLWKDGSSHVGNAGFENWGSNKVNGKWPTRETAEQFLTDYLSAKNMKLKMKVWLKDKRIEMQILYQDPRFVALPVRWLIEYYAQNGVIITTNSYPDLSKDCSNIWLRGSWKAMDSAVAAAEFGSNQERDAFYAKMIEALKDWAANAPEFQEPPIVLEF